ncbi:MAG TPA: type II toxin-antitoxin system HicB family antitoxin [Thermoanaerobaculia bacterium]|jgi:predicted RNase H-like HicB family nuclease|nr:type II toxin-antitoxin system HicB family antitoxin [Thermoanaerobaculia bacterium]HQN10258.1 type II toxin-antitoxin system HicB family antitoxin [Thermoanaerobaculia bacterium]HQP86745.1 type II toxin-antitoxin system HicB family antitoxin [Thermoanaerobaculia bacterium]
MSLADRIQTAGAGEEALYTRLHGETFSPRRSRLLGTMSSAESMPDETAMDAVRYAPIVSWLTELVGGPDEATLRLSCPVRFDVTVEPDSEGFIAFMPFLASAGTGDTYEEALRDLSESIRGLKAALDSEPLELLAPDAARIKARLAYLLG